MTKPKLTLSKRMVNPRFWDNADLSDLEKTSGIRNLRLTMIGLWGMADESGIFEWKPRELAGHLYKFNAEDQATVGPAMEAMVEHQFLRKLEIDGEVYGVWPNWGEHNDFAHKGQTRYPDAYAAHYGEAPSKVIGRGQQPNTAPAVKQQPSTAESRLEVRKLGSNEVEVKVLPTIQPSIQETTGDSVQEESNLPAENLAKLLFKLLDKPRDQRQNAGLWETQVAVLLKDGHSEDEIAAVMEHAVKNDTFSAEYLTLAKQPMASFVKTYDNLHKGWKALEKGAAAAANKAAKLKPTTTTHGTHTGLEF